MCRPLALDNTATKFGKDSSKPAKNYEIEAGWLHREYGSRSYKKVPAVKRGASQRKSIPPDGTRLQLTNILKNKDREMVT